MLKTFIKYWKIEFYHLASLSVTHIQVLYMIFPNVIWDNYLQTNTTDDDRVKEVNFKSIISLDVNK